MELTGPSEPPTTARRSQRATPKLQRWIDLLATLLVRHWPATFDELAKGVPAYADPAVDRQSRLRKFERDKDELRAFGVPIETVPGSDDTTGYQLRKGEFYLPYLTLLDAAGAPASRPRRIDADGYRALRALAFEPEELAAVAEAARRVRALGDPALAAHAGSAVRKLAFDLPLDAASEGEAHLVAARTPADPAVLDALGAALLARRRATFRYHSMERDEVAERTVEPWGLFFLGAHWYLAARDAAAGEGRAGLRNFRVSRVADVRVHAAGDGPEVVVPADFRLREHAQSRQAWELGDGDAELVLVAFRGETGVVRAARTLGQAVPADDPEAALAPAGTTLRRFRVRRREAFARWLLSFGGAARPLAPAAHVQGWRELARAARARYPEVPRGGTADDTLAALAPEPAR